MFAKKKSPPMPIDWKGHCERLSYQVQEPKLKEFYQAFNTPAHAPVRQVEFLALDLETTGLDPQNDHILSIGFLTLSHDRIFCDRSRHWIVQPEEQPENAQSTIHGITHSTLASCPAFGDTLIHLLRAMAGKVIIAHYSRIEREFLNQATLDCIGEPLEFPVIDTMELESRKHPIYRPNFIQRWMGDKNSPSLRMSHARERYGLPRYRPHHALTDALSTAELFLAQMADQFSPDTPVGQLWL
ncbi:MAG TPA: DNA polymerase III subunit epsilon [Desulfobacteraceae bacterium]|nr:DNA polymerase III subunit epsilon [Desulfobacteraceae bacterium]